MMKKRDEGEERRKRRGRLRRGKVTERRWRRKRRCTSKTKLSSNSNLVRNSSETS